MLSITKWDFMKLEKFCTTNYIIIQAKMQLQIGTQSFPVTQKVTIQNKQTQKLNMKKTNNPKLER